MSDIIEFIKYKPVHYTVHLSHDHNGFSVQVMDVAEDAESRQRVADALRKAADMIEEDV
jgi:uncharacterized protein (UPF0276 family)